MTQPQASGRAPSIRDVARLAGVSHQTVSRVLNAHPSIRPETRERVLAVMGELNYRPNRAARALVTSRSATLGVLSASSAQYGPASSIRAIERAARAEGYFVNTVNVDGSDVGEIEAALTHLLDLGIEGLVVIAPQVRVFDALVSLGLDLPFVTMQSTGRQGDHALSVDQITGARRATRHLIDLGHTRIQHLAGPLDWIEAEARIVGFHAELEAAGLPRVEPLVGDWTPESGYAAGQTIARDGGPTAVFSSNDQMALGLLHALRDAGLDVPGDVSVVGFDDIPEAAHFWPPLTTVRQDFDEFGRRCIGLLLAAIRSAPAEERALVPDLIVRSSTAPPRSR
ncbi:LacI family transcriptional regulator [Agreia sp. Leaf335]|uniref:LacI family DNA-binding transcriptional regulator n=1 Tax=Agreia sp. Leaf335 TaxID=1736340 RepID=UPI0006FECB97|nr:LacI family DNA-binding transcriptional regulator [Agreia sp. Leaf335]KQR24759.1 LacI family transcriptional regulator [Agreia sp. Leaf335]